MSVEIRISERTHEEGRDKQLKGMMKHMNDKIHIIGKKSRGKREYWRLKV